MSSTGTSATEDLDKLVQAEVVQQLAELRAEYEGQWAENRARIADLEAQLQAEKERNDALSAGIGAMSLQDASANGAGMF